MNKKLRLDGKVWMEIDDKFMGLGRVELLDHIESTGSINKAAKLMGMSYKKAWGLVQSMNEQSAVPLVTYPNRRHYRRRGEYHRGGPPLCAGLYRVTGAFSRLFCNRRSIA